MQFIVRIFVAPRLLPGREQNNVYVCEGRGGGSGDKIMFLKSLHVPSYQFVIQECKIEYRNAQ